MSPTRPIWNVEMTGLFSPSSAEQLGRLFGSAMVAALCLGVIVAAFVHLLRPLLISWAHWLTIRLWLSGFGSNAMKANRRQGQPEKAEFSEAGERLGSEWIYEVAERADVPGEFIKKNRSKFKYLISEYDLRTQPLFSFVLEMAKILPPKIVRRASPFMSGVPFPSSGQTTEDYMFAIQTTARAALVDPMLAPKLYRVVTAGLRLEVAFDLFLFEAISREFPEKAMRIAEEPSTKDVKRADAAQSMLSAILIAAQDEASRVIDRNLDALQRRLIASDSTSIRLIAVALGLAAALSAGGSTLDAAGRTTMVVGLVGGMLAVLFEEVAVGITGRLTR